MAKRAGYWDLKAFAAKLAGLTEGLPTDAEKAALRGHFEEIIAFLNQVQKAVESLPTSDDAVKARSALQALEQAEMKARSHPVLSAALGLTPPRVGRQRPSGFSEDEQTKASAILAELRTLSIDDMNARLRDSSITTRDVEALASIMGIRPNRRTTREVLMEQIVTKISNFRGYQKLQGGSQ